MPRNHRARPDDSSVSAGRTSTIAGACRVMRNSLRQEIVLSEISPQSESILTVPQQGAAGEGFRATSLSPHGRCLRQTRRHRKRPDAAKHPALETVAVGRWFSSTHYLVTWPRISPPGFAAVWMLT